MLDVYTTYRKVIRRLFRIPARTHNSTVIKLTCDLVSRLDCRSLSLKWLIMTMTLCTPSLKATFMTLDLQLMKTTDIC